MPKCLAFIAALLLAGSGWAQSSTAGSDLANGAIAADLGTTALGLSMGAAEANPLGLALLPLKLVVKAHIDRMPDEYERREATAQFTGLQFGAAAANLCTLALGNPAMAVLCFAGAMSVGYSNVKSMPTETDCFHRHAARFEEAAASHRIYKVSLKTCEGHFEPAPLMAQAAWVEASAGSAASPASVD
jgi:hypothetical protein